MRYLLDGPASPASYPLRQYPRFTGFFELHRRDTILPVGFALMALFSVQARAEYNPSFEWQTSEPSLLCPNPLALKEAQTAARSLDAGWLKETGCLFAQGGLRIALIEAVEIRGPKGFVWRGRIYPANGQPSFSAYFDESNALTYAIYGPFRTRQSAERETKPLVEDFVRRVPEATMPYEIVESPPRSFWARVGPQMYKGIDVFCLKVRNRELEMNRPAVPCTIVGKLA